MMKFDLRVKQGRVTSGAKIAVSAFKDRASVCMKKRLQAKRYLNLLVPSHQKL